MNGRGYIFILALFLLLTACQGVEVPSVAQPGDGYARAQLDVTLQVDNTKSVVEGTTLAQNGRTYGIIACEHEDVPTEFPIYDRDDANLYGNIQAWYGNYHNGSKYLGNNWYYSYEATTGARFRPLYFMTQNTARHMDIYAYAPWKSGVTVESGYTYSVFSDDLEDLMYATYEDALGNPTNRDLTIVDRETIPMNVKFHHALSRVVFHIKLGTALNTEFDGVHSITLNRILLLVNNGSSTPLYRGGIMDIVSGGLTPRDLATSAAEQGLNFSTELYLDNDWKVFNMLVNPTTYQNDGDFSFKFYYNGTVLNQTYPIKVSDLSHNDDPVNPTIGFQPGYCYHFYFIIDNYIHLQNVIVNQEWTTTEEQELKV